MVCSIHVFDDLRQALAQVERVKVVDAQPLVSQASLLALRNDWLDVQREVLLQAKFDIFWIVTISKWHINRSTGSKDLRAQVLVALLCVKPHFEAQLLVPHAYLRAFQSNHWLDVNGKVRL
jgi:hypothetical protein